MESIENPALFRFVWKVSWGDRLSAGVGRVVLQLPRAQEDDVGEAAERLEAPGSDDGDLNLAVDAVGDGMAGPER